MCICLHFVCENVQKIIQYCSEKVEMHDAPLHTTLHLIPVVSCTPAVSSTRCTALLFWEENEQRQQPQYKYRITVPHRDYSSKLSRH